MSTTETPIPQVSAEYEYDGMFDKDEQGWCCSRVLIEQSGRRVKVKDWYDANGITRSYSEREGTVGEVVDGKVAITFDDGRTDWFDLAARRLLGRR